jgi:alkanesulfonate monooxygenase SsuD/methylene tetrahydromethanopterin reductase-like flavin-dependent oxidoreductase (luciferase family)
LLTQERSNFSGRYFSLTDAMNNPKGPQDPLPICVGGAGLKRTLPTAARYAHHWNYGSPTMSVDDFAMRRDVFLGHLGEVGRSREEVTISTLVRYNGDLDAMVDEATAFADAGVDLGIVTIPKTNDPSIVETIAGALTALA